MMCRLRVRLLVLAWLVLFLAGGAGATGCPAEPAVAPPQDPNSVPDSPWTIEQVEVGRTFGSMGERSLALDAAGLPHIAYGGGHLYYAWHDGVAWHTETADPAFQVGQNTSLALDTAGYPHITYDEATHTLLKYAFYDGSAWVTTTVASGLNALYSAILTPISATYPIITWNNGAAGPTANYSWPATGTYTVAGTVTTPCAEAHDALSVTVFCQSLAGIGLSGPSSLSMGLTGTYRAAAEPITASRPLTFTWDNGTLGPTATYSWTMTGTYTITVTGTNPCGAVLSGVLPVRVLAEWPYHIYLPLMMQPGGFRRD